MSHECRAVACDVTVSAGKLMCRTHWSMVPADLRRAVLVAWRSRQTILTPSTSTAYVGARARAITAVAAAEGRELPTSWRGAR